jgi:hypothetical protein
MENFFYLSPARFVSLTLVDARREIVVEAIQNILDVWIVKTGYRTNESSLDLSLIYELEPPAGGAHPFKLVAFSPANRPTSTAIVTNFADGWNSLSYALAKKSTSLVVQIISTQDGVEYPKHSFQVWRDGVRNRVVHVLRDSDKWTFFQEGPIDSFETPAHYDRRRIRDRLNREIIVEYVRALGWDIADGDFWRSKECVTYFEKGVAGHPL